MTVLLVAPPAGARAFVPWMANPQLHLHQVLATAAFPGSNVSMRDNEGAAYVPRDHSLWLADDNARMLYEVDAETGALKRVIGRTTLQQATRLGGGPVAGSLRSWDLEALAYDAATDTLYAFSGSCCSPDVRPAVYRLTRAEGTELTVDSYQPLAAGSDFTAAAWSPRDGKLYVSAGSSLRPYDYATNQVGPVSTVEGLRGVYGLAFSADGNDLFVTRRSARLSRVDWDSGRLVAGWTFDLARFGLLDPRAVEVIDDRLWVSDGSDRRPASDPLAHGVYVFAVSAPSAPSASFTASPRTGPAPLQVSFTDGSLGAPTRWYWDFGDGASADVPSPTHTFPAEGTFPVTLTVWNALGASTSSTSITVAEPLPPSASFAVSASWGVAPLEVSVEETAARAVAWEWDLGNGPSATGRKPVHVFTEPGTYMVTLKATNVSGTSTSTRAVTVAGPPGPHVRGTDRSHQRTAAVPT